MNTQFDLIAIGGGSGGLAVAETAAKAGLRVAMIDPQPLGGTCVNAGCVPKKVMWNAAEHAVAARAAADYAIPVEVGQVDWAALVEKRRNYIQPIHDYWTRYVNELGIEHIQGRAQFVDANTVQVEGQQYHADRIVIATGGAPIVPPVPNANLGMTSDGFFQLTAQPKNVAIIGAGYIGVELAGVLRSLGSDVSIIGLDRRLLVAFDESLSHIVADSLEQDGVSLHLNFQVTALEGEPGNIHVTGNNGVRLGSFDAVIWAVGRKPNISGLALDKAGVHTERGVIPVDQWQKTNVDTIYAVGDVTGQVALTPVAVAVGRKLGRHLTGDQQVEPMDFSNIPTVVFAHPPLGMIGLTEQQAHQQHRKITVYQTEFTPMKYGLGEHGKKTFFKMICAGVDEKIVGLHLAGDGVDEMLQGFAVAVVMGATKADFDRTVAIHPSSAEELVTLKAADRIEPLANRKAA